VPVTTEGEDERGAGTSFTNVQLPDRALLLVSEGAGELQAAGGDEGSLTRPAEAY